MLGALTRQATRLIALTLVGVGLGDGASLLGLAEYGAIVGIFVGSAGALLVLVTTGAWNHEVIRAWANGGFRGYELLTPGFFRAVSLGFLGVGLLVGSMTSASPLLLVAGVAGLLVLALTQRAGTT